MFDELFVVDFELVVDYGDVGWNDVFVFCLEGVCCVVDFYEVIVGVELGEEFFEFCGWYWWFVVVVEDFFVWVGGG